MEVEHACPQCGAPVVLAESDRLLSCPFCRVRLYLWSAEVFRYRIPPAPAVNGRPDLVYVPYGRFRGMLFDLEEPDQGKERVLDTSFLATPAALFPITLGLRPQTLKLRPAFFSSADRCLAPRIAPEHRPLLGGQTPSRPDALPSRSPRRATVTVGEVRSLIYAPFFEQRGRWHDGVLNTPLGEAPAGSPPPEYLPEAEKPWALHFIPTLCPDCGWDLAGVSESCLLFCPQCRSGWEPGESELQRFSFFSQPVPPGRDDYFFLPFWHFELPYAPADYFRLPFSRLLGLQAGQSPPWQREHGRGDYWVPAFKISPRVFLRLARTATQAPGAGTDLAPLLPERHHPVTLPAAEAQRCIQVIQACLDREAIVLESSRPRIEDGDWEKRLVFMPFLDTAHELIQPRSRLGISKNCLNLGKYI
jgi:hypothetical protein